MTQQQFEIGDKVLWQSSAGGYRATKIGTVVGIVPPGKSPFSTPNEIKVPEGYCTTKLGGGLARRAISYFVAVERQKSKPLLYWPNASQLQRFADVQEGQR